MLGGFGMRKIKRLWRILKMTSVDKLVIGFITFFFFSAFVISLVEPYISNYGDAVWYVFVAVTTIGFGDYTAITMIGRVTTIFVSIYGIIVIAMIPGVLVSYYLEFMKLKEDETISMFMEKLENLDSLSKEELHDISMKVKKHRYKDKNIKNDRKIT